MAKCIMVGCDLHDKSMPLKIAVVARMRALAVVLWHVGLAVERKVTEAQAVPA